MYTVETGLVSCDNQIVNDSVTVTRVCSSICKSKSRLDSCVDLEVNDLRSETAVCTSETGVVSCRNLALIDSVTVDRAGGSGYKSKSRLLIWVRLVEIDSET